jgi:hypothetical protein
MFAITAGIAGLVYGSGGALFAAKYVAAMVLSGLAKTISTRSLANKDKK